MGSHPTLDHQELAAEALKLDPDDWSHGHAIAHLAVEHPQVRSWPDGNHDLAHELEHRDWTFRPPPPPPIGRAGRRAGLRPPQPHLRRSR
jgi:hypothetical protein